MAHAGGIDRSGQGISTLFEPGELVEFTFGYVSPDVSGLFDGRGQFGRCRVRPTGWSVSATSGR